MKVFLDTNVILDVLAGRHPFFVDSQRVMTFCERNSGTGMASVLTFCTVAYVLQRHSMNIIIHSAVTTATAAAAMTFLCEIFNPTTSFLLPVVIIYKYNVN